MLYVAYKDGSGTTIAIDNSVITMIGDGNWELKERAITAPSTASSLILGFGCVKNGNVYFCEPVLSDKDALTANNVYIRQSEDSHKLNVYDMSGAKIGTLSLT